ncbi:MAG: hypothetical protein GXO65_01475 [Euryarchaeota archaeon]|nr:hypothetical protein [Euryarchaeota archaeon]
MSVLLSIKPKYVKEIIAGNKKYEFRKSIWKRNDLEKVYIYSSTPMKKIVGFFSIGDIIEDNPENLWSEFKDFSGLAEDEFFNYFNSHETGYAIEIDQVDVFKKPIDPYQQVPNFRPPQSFCYFESEVLAK